MKRYAVIIPIYRNFLGTIDKFSLSNNIRKLKKYDIYFIMPKELKWNCLSENTQLKTVRFDKKFFQGYQGYSQLLLSEEFYQAFEDYEKILICQLDVYVFDDRMEYFASLSYDYIGAPAFLNFDEDGAYELMPGNGGFSLRDVKMTLRLLRNHAQERDAWEDTEDEFYSCCGKRYPDEFRIAPVSVAASFAFDRFASVLYEWRQHQLPFGIHAWHLYAPQLVCQFSKNNHQYCLDDVLKIQTEESIMSPFYEFLSRNSSVILYGAGGWGKVIGRALQILRIRIICYAVSDGYVKPQKQFFGIPIFCWSEIKTLPRNTGAILSMSQRYLPLEEREKLHQIIRKRGITDILDVDNQLFNFIAEIILKKGGKKNL